MGTLGFEPRTSRLSAVRANQAEPRALKNKSSLFTDTIIILMQHYIYTLWSKIKKN